MLFIEQERMDEAQVLYEELVLVAGENYGSPTFMGCLAEMYLSAHDYVKARIYIEKGWSVAEDRQDSVGLYLSSSEVLNATGYEKDAYQELLKGMKLQKAHSAVFQKILRKATRSTMPAATSALRIWIL